MRGDIICRTVLCRICTLILPPFYKVWYIGSLCLGITSNYHHYFSEWYLLPWGYCLYHVTVTGNGNKI